MLTSPADRKPTDALERRTAPRIAAGSFPGIKSIRISPMGSDATLVNLSSTGALVRCLTRMLPGTPVTLVFEGQFSPSSVKGKVVRCLVADIARPAGLSYHIGIAFNTSIPLAEDEAAEAKAPAAAAPVQVLVNRW